MCTVRVCDATPRRASTCVVSATRLFCIELTAGLPLVAEQSEDRKRTDRQAHVQTYRRGVGGEYLHTGDGERGMNSHGILGKGVQTSAGAAADIQD